jgi:glutamate carboxypeptidase
VVHENARFWAKAAAFGRQFSEGISAIEELRARSSRCIALTALTKGTTVNIGLILGRAGPSTRSRPGRNARTTWRYGRPADREDAMSQDRAHRRDCERARHQAQVRDRAASSSRWSRAPKTNGLFEHYAELRQGTVELKVEGEFTGGCADSGFTPRVGTPTICAVGRSAARRTRRTNTWWSTRSSRARRPGAGGGAA